MNVHQERKMPGHADMMFGDWVYDEAPHEVYDCNSLATRRNLNTFEKSVLKACEMVLSRKTMLN